MASNKFGIPNKLKKIDENLLLEILPDSLDAYDEPFYDSSSIPTYLVSKLMSQTSKVALSGMAEMNYLGVIRDILGRTTILIFLSLKYSLSFLSKLLIKVILYLKVLINIYQC